MKFGILFNTDYHASVHGDPDHYYGELLDQAVLAEELGFDAVWWGEHHYERYSFGAPAVLATAAAARTSRIRLGTGVSLLPIHPPIRLAEEYATLDNLSGGRLEYGIGRGFLRYALDLFGVEEGESPARYREAADLIVRAWTADGPFSFDGQFTQLRDYTFFPPPLQKPHPPIYASAVLTPESYRWTAERGFHLATACFVPDQEGVRKGVQLYRELVAQHGHDPASREVAGVFQMYCGESNEQAHGTAGEHVVDYFQFFGAIDRKRPHQSEAYAHHGGGSADLFAGITSEALDEQRMVLIGDPEKLVERIRWAREYYDLDYLLLEVGQGGLPPAEVVASLQRFGREVIPVFAGDRGRAS